MAEQKKTAANKASSSEESAETGAEPVCFNWNGHTWDAYEVLGIPFGSDFEAVERAYRKELSLVGENAKAFVRQAFESIRIRQGKSEDPG